MLSKRVRDIGFSPTLAVSDLARRMRSDGIDVVDFSAGQPDFPSPDAVKNAGKAAIDSDRTGYTATAGIPELRAVIAERYRAERDLLYAPEEILVSPGAKASLYFACQTLFESGDEVIVPSPYWTSYPEQVRLAGAEPVFVPCHEDHGFRLTADDLRAAITPRTRGLFLNTPSNPTGAVYSRNALAPLAELCVERGLWVLADEIYCKLIYDDAPFVGIAQLGTEIRDRTIVIDGVSKTYSMTGWRIGYAAGPAEVISAMGKLQSHSTSNATSISQWAAVEALRMSDAELQPRIDEFRARRDAMLRGIREIRGWSCALPEGSFYLFPNVAGCFGNDGKQPLQSGQDVARFLLEEARVAVVPGEAFGSPKHVRLSYALSMDGIRDGLERIARALY
jgi:aspartate aminotransferase